MNYEILLSMDRADCIARDIVRLSLRFTDDAVEILPIAEPIKLVIKEGQRCSCFPDHGAYANTNPNCQIHGKGQR